MIHTADHTPAHCHVYRLNTSRDIARVKLDPVELWDYIGFKPSELAAILDIVRHNQSTLLAVWDSIYPTR